MPYRKRHRGTTTQRGYGASHVAALKRHRAAFVPGQPCAYCGQPIWDLAYADLAHTPDRQAYEGLQHRACNRREGAVRGNRMRRLAKGWASARRW
jgi:hypothetical protein